MKEDKNGGKRRHGLFLGTQKENQGTISERKEYSKDSNTSEKNARKEKKELSFDSRSTYTQEAGKNGVFLSLLGLAHGLQLLHWEYNMETVITNHLDRTRFTVCKYMERKVDSDGIPIEKKERGRMTIVRVVLERQCLLEEY